MEKKYNKKVVKAEIKKEVLTAHTDLFNKANSNN